MVCRRRGGNLLEKLLAGEQNAGVRETRQEIFCQGADLPRRETKMINVTKVFALFLVGVVFCCGCGIVKPGPDEAQDKDKRETELLRAIERKFENPDAHFELGQLYHSDGLWDKAEYEYKVALKFDPVHRRAQAAMVRLLLGSGDKAKATRTANIYVDHVSSSVKESLQLGRAFQEQGLEEYALRCFQQGLELAPNSAVVHKQLGYYYLSKNNKARAEEYLRRSFQLDPYQPEVAGELGRLGVSIEAKK